MTAMLIFGLRLAPLFTAIAQVESDRGATSANVYQIRGIYVQDVNRIYCLANGMEYRHRDVLDKDKAEMMMFLYWKHYAALASKEGCFEVSYETLARIHNGGPDGWKRKSTVGYWRKVKRELEKQGIKTTNTKRKDKMK